MGPKHSITCKGSPVCRTLKPAREAWLLLHSVNMLLEADPQTIALFLSSARTPGLSTSLRDKAAR